MRKMITDKQIEALDKLDEHIKIDQEDRVIINDGLKIGTFTNHFKLCATNDNNDYTPICNANWTTLYPILPVQFDWSGKPVFANKLNDGMWTVYKNVFSYDILISKNDFNTLAPTKLVLYSDEAKDYYSVGNVDKIEIINTYGNKLTYVWDSNKNAFTINSFTPLTGTRIESIRFDVEDTNLPVYFEL